MANAAFFTDNAPGIVQLGFAAMNGNKRGLRCQFGNFVIVFAHFAVFDMPGILHRHHFKIGNFLISRTHDDRSPLLSQQLQHFRTRFAVNVVNNPLSGQNQDIAADFQIGMNAQSHFGCRSQRDFRAGRHQRLIFLQSLGKSTRANDIFDRNFPVLQIFRHTALINKIFKVLVAGKQHCPVHRHQPVAVQKDLRPEFPGCRKINIRLVEPAADNRRNHDFSGIFPYNVKHVLNILFITKPRFLTGLFLRPAGIRRHGRIKQNMRYRFARSQAFQTFPHIDRTVGHVFIVKKVAVRNNSGVGLISPKRQEMKPHRVDRAVRFHKSFHNQIFADFDVFAGLNLSDVRLRQPGFVKHNPNSIAGKL